MIDGDLPVGDILDGCWGNGVISSSGALSSGLVMLLGLYGWMDGDGYLRCFFYLLSFDMEVATLVHVGISLRFHSFSSHRARSKAHSLLAKWKLES